MSWPSAYLRMKVLEAINQVLPTFRNRTRYNKSDIYRACIEKGILCKNQIAPTEYNSAIHSSLGRNLFNHW